MNIFKRIRQAVLVIMFAAFISLPMLGSLTGLDPDIKIEEKRRPAPKPYLKLNKKDLSRFPDRYNKYFDDHFGFRNLLIYGYNYVMYFWFHESSSPYVRLGNDGWLFYEPQEPKSVYSRLDLFSESRVDLIKRYINLMHGWMKAHDVELLFVVVPNKHTIYQELIPGFITRADGMSQMNQFLSLCSEEDVPVLDVRDALFEGKKREPVYYAHDTHWNHAGRHVVYRKIIKHISSSYPGLKPVERESMVETRGKRTGDLAELLGFTDELMEDVVYLEFPVDGQVTLAEQRYSNLKSRHVFENDDKELPRAILCGDSFGVDMSWYLRHHFERMVVNWSYKFNPREIEREKPDIVIYEFLERFLCHESQLWNDYLKLLREVKGLVPASSCHKETGENVVEIGSEGWLIREAREGRDKRGWLVFGHYATLQTGSYSAVFRARINEVNDTPVVKLQVVADNGKIILAEKEVSGITLKDHGGWKDVMLQFFVDRERVKNVELRVKYLGGADVAIDTLSIEKMPASLN